MRILFYNWTDILDPARRGGGVTVYQRNIVHALRQSGIHTVATLAAGLAYDRRGRPGIVKIADEPVPRYQLVNSGTLAPSHASFSNPSQITEARTEGVFRAFLDETGPWDVVHFSSLEGLPAKVLDLAAAHVRPHGGRVILSLHNYYPFCPQVNLWFQERESCGDFGRGVHCVRCLPTLPNPRIIRKSYRITDAMQRAGLGPGTLAFDKVLRPGLSLGLRLLRQAVALRRLAINGASAQSAPAQPGGVRPSQARHFLDRRRTMIETINRCCDQVLCVSDRVRQIAVAFGIDPDKALTDYIGTNEAECWNRTAPRSIPAGRDGGLHLAYLGYMRRDKGFHFLMQALLSLPPAIAGRLTLTVAARRGQPDAMALLEAVRGRIGRLIHLDGYGHDDLDRILSDVDIGLIPVLWEDNLPQVALEMHARHIPLITSDRGGAQELALSRDLVFAAGDAADFGRVVAEVLDGKIDWPDLWHEARPPTGMSTHVERLLRIYSGDHQGR